MLNLKREVFFSAVKKNLTLLKLEDYDGHVKRRCLTMFWNRFLRLHRFGSEKRSASSFFISRKSSAFKRLLLFRNSPEKKWCCASEKIFFFWRARWNMTFGSDAWTCEGTSSSNLFAINGFVDMSHNIAARLGNGEWWTVGLKKKELMLRKRV